MKSLVLVAFLVIVLEVISASDAFRRRHQALGNRRQRHRELKTILKRSRFLRRPPPAQNPTSSSYTFPLSVSGDGDDFYQINVAIGTPPQRFNLTLDSENIATVLLGKGIKTDVYDHCKVTAAVQRRYYDKSASTSARGWTHEYDLDNGWMNGEPLVDHNTCSDGYNANGNATNDVVQVCSKFTSTACSYGPSQRLDIGVIFEIDAALSPKWAADGIFGMDPTQALEPEDVGTFTKFLNSFENPTYTLVLNRRELSQSAQTGSITFGEPYNPLCDNKWFNVGGDPYSQYGISITGTLFGSSASQDSHTTFLSVSTAYLHVSSALLNTVVIKLHGEYDYYSDQYHVDCAKIKTAPHLGLFTAAGSPIDIPPSDYIRQFNGKCVLMFTDENLQIGSEWYLGTTILRSYCMRYNDAHWTLDLSKKLAN